MAELAPRNLPAYVVPVAVLRQTAFALGSLISRCEGLPVKHPQQEDDLVRARAALTALEDYLGAGDG